MTSEAVLDAIDRRMEARREVSGSTLNGERVRGRGARRRDAARPSCAASSGVLSVRETCGIGVCGACTVLVDGEPISACLLLAPLVEGAAVTTVEGLGARPPGPARVRRGARLPVRLLHARDDPDGRGASRARARSRPTRRSGSPRRQPVPLRLLREDRRRGARAAAALMPALIDLLHLGRAPRHRLLPAGRSDEPALVDCGPASCVAALDGGARRARPRRSRTSGTSC